MEEGRETAEPKED